MVLSKEAFLMELDRLLEKMPDKERQEICLDYADYIDQAVEKGAEEEAVVQSLGSVKEIAKQYRVKRYIDKAEARPSFWGIVRAIMATIGLGFFNIIFILGPFVSIVVVLIALFVASLAVGIGGAGLILGGIFPQFVHGINFHMLASDVQGQITAGLLFGGVGTICLSGLLTLGTLTLSKGFFKVTLKYLRLNIRLIRGAERGDKA